MLTEKQKEEIINLVFADYEVKEEYIQSKKENNNIFHFILEDEINQKLELLFDFNEMNYTVMSIDFFEKINIITTTE